MGVCIYSAIQDITGFNRDAIDKKHEFYISSCYILCAVVRYVEINVYYTQLHCVRKKSNPRVLFYNSGK